MANWIISYQKDNNTSTLTVSAATKPSMEDAAGQLLAWARKNLAQGDYGAAHEKPGDTPIDMLLHLYGITITGITRE
ncbi:hypothetical protein LNN38_19790 [Pseudomonas sp. LA21]|uniref:hypothetical protein n=1 Tax=unclassified Pseudomonas TaxID=196821 RepID=UPI001FB80793|nr:hypothetical protein [Pseudomonas sp. LA21]MCJ1887113.1 hypothetical protein [Pseudomonas sp. LA21]